MRSTYLAIVQTDPKGYEAFSVLLREQFSPEEIKVKEEIATRLFTNPESVSESEGARAFAEDGQARARNLFEKKLDKVVKKLFKNNELGWGVFRVMMSGEFFVALNPDTNLSFDVRYPAELHPEGIILPDCTWAKGEFEDVIDGYKTNAIFVFISVDN